MSAEKQKPKLEISTRNLKDLIRDCLYAYADKGGEKGRDIVIPVHDVHKIAKQIAKRARIGPK